MIDIQQTTRSQPKKYKWMQPTVQFLKNNKQQQIQTANSSNIYTFYKLKTI